MKVRPAIVIVPILGSPLVLNATEYHTVAFPLRRRGKGIVIQLALLTAVQVHPGSAMTVTDASPPVTPNVLLVGFMIFPQTPTAAASVTVKVRPAIVIVPLRELALVFEATE